MIGKIDESLNFHGTALMLRSQRQQLLASNIVNADTPGYQARDFDFTAALRSAMSGSAGMAGQALSGTDHRHVSTSSEFGGQPLQYRTAAQASLDGNSVDMDIERARFAENAVRYDAALKFLNHQIKTLLSAIQG